MWITAGAISVLLTCMLAILLKFSTKDDFALLPKPNILFHHPPVAKKVEEIIRIRNRTIVDNYTWLKHLHTDPDVLRYISQENAFTNATLRKTERLQNALLSELEGDHWQQQDFQDEISQFWEWGNYSYYIWNPSNRTYPIYLRRNTLSTECQFIPDPKRDQVVLDYNDWIPASASYFSPGIFEVSPDGNLLAFSFDLKGSEEFVLGILDLVKGTKINIPLVYTYYSGRWFFDHISNATYFYFNTVDDVYGIPRHIYRICITECSVSNFTTELIYSEPDIALTVELKLTNDLAYLFIKVHRGSLLTIQSAGQITSEYRLAHLPGKVLLKREQGVYYDVEHHQGFFYVRINTSPAINYHIIKIETTMFIQKADVSQSSFEVVVPHSAALIEMHEVFKGNLVLWIRTDGLREIEIIPLNAKSLPKRIIFQDPLNPHTQTYSVFPGTIDDMESRLYRRYDSSCFSFTNSSFLKERQTFVYNFQTESTIRSRERIAQTLSQEYLEMRLWVPSSNTPGIKIPISLLTLRGQSHSGAVLVRSYGAYGSFIDPAFNKDIFPLVNRGVSFALCHPRGDGDMGSQWYMDGKYEKKINTFLDTQDCVRGLLDAKIAQQGKVALYARSAGGLIAGYLINHSTDIAVIVTQVPFVDPVQDMMDDTVPWTAFEWFEWGNPLKDDSILEAMLQYSPYDNIKSKSYPAIMITAGLEDARVPFWEPIKFVAKLRASQSLNRQQERETLLRVTNYGHFAGSRKELVEWYAFILVHLFPQTYNSS